METKPLITVFGATGRQGGSVARAALARGDWTVRAVTRRTDSPAARALAAQGAQLCQADLDHADSLAAALDGAQAVFGVINFWENGDPLRELRQAANLAAAARSSRPAQLIWSTLEDSRTVLSPPKGQRFAVPHLDAKAEANALFLASGLPVTLLLTSFFWENLIDFGMGPQRGEDDVLELALPLGQALLPGLAVADIGPCAMALLDGVGTDRVGSQRVGAQWAGAQRRVGIAGEHLSGPQMAGALADALAEPVRWRDVALSDYARLPFPGAAELAAMFEFKQRANPEYCAARPVQVTRALHPGLTDFRGWLRANAQATMPVPSGNHLPAVPVA